MLPEKRQPSKMPFLLFLAAIGGMAWIATPKPQPLTDAQVIDLTTGAQAQSAKGKILDRIEGSESAGPVVPKSDPGGEWSISRFTSPKDDSPGVTISAASEFPVSDRFGRPKIITAIVQCREGRTDFIINFADFFMSDHQSWGRVLIRVDKEKARTFDMVRSTDHNSLGLWGGTGTRFLKTLVGKKSMFVAAFPFNEAELQMTFSLRGFDAALAEVRKTCRW